MNSQVVLNRRSPVGGYRTALGALVVLLLFATASCINPYIDVRHASEPREGTGIRVTGFNAAEGIRAATVFPDLSLADIHSYRVEVADGPGAGQAQVVRASGGGLAEPVEFRDLVPGSWTLIVSGYDRDPSSVDPAARKIVSGIQTIRVRAGNFSDVTVPIGFIDGGEGDWNVTLSWPTVEGDGGYARTDVVTGHRVWINGEAVDPALVSIDLDSPSRVLAIAESARPSGSFWLTVELTADKPAPYETVARYDELWYVRGNLTTRKTVALRESDFSFGGGSRIVLDLSEIERYRELRDNYFVTAPSTTEAGDQFVITAAGIEGATFAWRIDGTPVTGATTGASLSDGGATLTLDTGTAEAGVVKRLTLVVEKNGMLYSASHAVRLVVSEVE